MHAHGGVRGGRRLLTGVVLAVAMVALGAVPSGAQEPPIEVEVVDSYGIGGEIYRDCDGVDQPYPGFAAVQVATSAPVDADLTVPVTYGGDPATALIDPPASVIVAAGEDFAFLDLALASGTTGVLTVTFEAGDGYTVADPATVEIPLDAPGVVLDCTEPLADDVFRQVIPVGGTPAPFGFYGADELLGIESDPTLAALFDTIVEGELPPGLGYADDVWSGAATQAGTYPFEVRACFEPDAFDEVPVEDATVEPVSAEGRARRGLEAAVRADAPEVLCVGTLDAEITVVPAAAPTSAPAATPVRSSARFTG